MGLLVSLAAIVAYVLAATQFNPRLRYQESGLNYSEAAVDSILSARNSNDKTPVIERLGVWLFGVVRGDLGRTVENTPVSEQIGRRMWVSVRIMLLGAILGSFFGILTGAYAAVRQYKAFDIAVGVFSFVVLSTPIIVLAVLYKVAAINLNNLAGFTMIHVIGEYTPGINFWTLSGIADRISHLILPTLTLMSVSIAIYSRYQRNAMLDVLGSDFLRTARSKGLRRSQAIVKHGLRTAVIPLFTYFAYQFALLFVGATFTETIFGWHGMGVYFVDSVRNQDVNSVAGITLFVAVLVLIAGLISDLANAVLDPRVRAE